MHSLDFTLVPHGLNVVSLTCNHSVSELNWIPFEAPLETDNRCNLRTVYNRLTSAVPQAEFHRMTRYFERL